MGIAAVIAGASIVLTLALEIAERRINPLIGTIDGCVAILTSAAFMHADGII